MNFKGNLAVFEESARVVSKGNGKNKLSAAEEIILGILHNGKGSAKSLSSNGHLKKNIDLP
jgi:hypothetical protein